MRRLRGADIKHCNGQSENRILSLVSKLNPRTKEHENIMTQLSSIQLDQTIIRRLTRKTRMSEWEKEKFQSWIKKQFREE